MTAANNGPDYNKYEDKGKSGALILLIILVFIILNGIFNWIQIN